MERGRRIHEFNSAYQFEHQFEPEPEIEEDANIGSDQLLKLAQTHLRLRNFSLCHQYATELHTSPHYSHHRNNHRTSALHLLTISHILSSATSFSLPNHYSILQLDTFSTDPNLILTHFNKLTSFLDPIKHTSPLAQEALDYVHMAYRVLSDHNLRDNFDGDLKDQLSEGKSGHEFDGFWTFCPYCFNMYEYDKAYEGCCLRCPNSGCRRAFHGVVLNSLPKMDLDKGRYFGCFGFFPVGLSPETKEEKFGSWAPIMGLFPCRRVKAPAGRMDLNDDDDDGGGEFGGFNVGNGVDFVNLDDSDGSEAKGENFEGNCVPSGFPMGGERPRGMKRKTVARNAKKLRSRRRMNGVGSSERPGCYEDEGEDEGFGFEGNDNAGGGEGVGDLNEGDMTFFEEDGEIFVGLGPDDDAP